MAPSWNLPELSLREKIGPGEVGHAVPWNSLTAEQKQFQPIKMALHAAMIHRMDIEIAFVRRSNRSEEHTSELQSRPHLVCRLLLEKKKRLPLPLTNVYRFAP